MARVAGVSKGREAMRAWIAEDRERAREYVRARTAVCPDTGCWLWQKRRDRAGYGGMGTWINGKSFSWYAHIVSYEAFVKSVPDGLVLRHKCDNRACANPAHMELGTHADNSRDMVDRERQARGERNPLAKLTESDVLGIVEMRRGGMTLKAIAAHSGVYFTTVHKICAGHTWAHVTGIDASEETRRSTR